MFDFKAYINGEEFENTEFDFKEIVSHKNYETWAKEVVAFANGKGGRVFFGIRDDDNELVGLTREAVKTDILYINEICDKKIHPRVDFHFIKHGIGNDLFVIEMVIAGNDEKPVWLTRSDEEDVIYVRRDAQSVIAHGDQIEKMVLSSKRKPYDAAFTDLSFDESSFTELAGLYREKRGPEARLTAKLLQAKGAVSADGKVSKGLMLFADSYRESNCTVACRIWPGLSKGSSVMIDRKVFQGNLLDALSFAKNYIGLYTKRGLVKLDAGGREAIISYPDRAVDEALINAFAHRDYHIDGAQIDVDIFPDRIQIASPGSFLLPGNAQDYSMVNIPSRRRNEVVCGILELCDLMEASGSGFEKIVESYIGFEDRFKPSVYSDPAQFIITLRDLTYDSSGAPKATESANKPSFEFKPPRSGNREYDRRILEFCLLEPKSRQEIQDFLELYDRKNFIYSILNPLVDSELLLLTQQSRNAPNQKYYTNKERIRFK